MPIPSFTSTVSSVSSSIRILYILVIIDGSEPNLPAIVICSPLLDKSGAIIAINKTMTIAASDSISFLYDNFCIKRNTKSKIIASKAAGIAPININEESLRSIPSKMRSPKPPAPINAASVAVPMIKTIAVRIPAIITGIAIGNSTLRKRRHGFIPIPFAASTSDWSTSAIPVYVLRRIGSNAYTTSAMTAGTLPIPKSGIINPNNASEGIVCKTAAIFMTISDSRFVFVSKIPKGTPINAAINNAIKDS